MSWVGMRLEKICKEDTVEEGGAEEGALEKSVFKEGTIEAAVDE